MPPAASPWWALLQVFLSIDIKVSFSKHASAEWNFDVSKGLGHSVSVCNVELVAQCSECLFQGWNKTYANPLPMEFSDCNQDPIDSNCCLVHLWSEADWISSLVMSVLFQMTGWRRLRLAHCTSSRPSPASSWAPTQPYWARCPSSVRETQALFPSLCAATSWHIIQEESVIGRQIRLTAAGCGMSTPGRWNGPRSCIVVLVANYILLHIVTSILHILTVTSITCFFDVTTYQLHVFTWTCNSV